MKRLNRTLTVFVFALATVLVASNAAAQNTPEEKPSEKGVSYGKESKAHWRVGVQVTASKGPMQSVLATVPVPISWPEQKIRLIDEDISRGVRVKQRNLNGVRQLVISMGRIPNGATAHALYTIEVTRKEILAPKDTSVFKIPRKAPRDIKRWLNGSPYIESRDSKIRSLARETTKEVDGDWEKVEAIYEFVRENIEYQEGKIKTTTRALKDGVGDCEELTSVFIAMCRASKVPARMVWVPDHCYPEFYLQDDDGEGHWFPCQAAGTRAFGSMPEMRPILQKGDNFKVPEKNKPQRYVAEHVSAKPVRGSGKPRVTFVREYVQPKGSGAP